MISPPSLSCSNSKGEKMMRCNMCGAPVKPWFDECYECYNPTSRSVKIPEPIAAKSFMQKMEIDGRK